MATARRLLDWRVVLVIGLLALAPAPALLFSADDLPVPAVGVGLGIPLALLALAAGVALLRESPLNGAGLVFAGWALALAGVSIAVGLGPTGFGVAAASLVFFGIFPASALALHPGGRMPDALTRRLFLPVIAMVAVAGAGVVAASPVVPGGGIARFCQFSQCANPVALTADGALTAPAARAFLALSLVMLALTAWAVTRQMLNAPPDRRQSMLPASLAGLAWAAVAATGAVVQMVTVFATSASWIQPLQTALAVLIPVGALIGVVMRARAREDALPRMLRAIEAAQSMADVHEDLRRITGVDLHVVIGAPAGHAPPGSVLLPIRSRDGAVAGALRLDTDARAAHPELAAILPALGLAIERDAMAGRIASLDEGLAVMRRDAETGRAEEREAIARDLHDGVQQQLIALRFRLGALESMIHRDPDSARGVLDELAVESELAIAAIRDLGRGGAPAGLRAMGLREALRADVARLPIDVDLDIRGAEDLPPGIARTAYFICLEGIQNALKHRGPGASCRVEVACDRDTVRFRITTGGDGATAIRTGDVPVPRTIAQRAGTAHGHASAEVRPDGTHVVQGAIPREASGARAVEDVS